MSAYHLTFEVGNDDGRNGIITKTTPYHKHILQRIGYKHYGDSCKRQCTRYTTLPMMPKNEMRTAGTPMAYMLLSKDLSIPME